MKRCPCRKVLYRDRIGAMFAMSQVQHKDGPRRPKMESRVYRCPHNKGWHLTSRR